MKREWERIAVANSVMPDHLHIPPAQDTLTTRQHHEGIAAARIRVEVAMGRRKGLCGETDKGEKIMITYFLKPTVSASSSRSVLRCPRSQLFAPDMLRGDTGIAVVA